MSFDLEEESEVACLTEKGRKCTEMTYTERLKCLKLHSLKGRRLRGEFIETYRIFNNLEGIELHYLFSLAKSDKTRNAEGKIYVEHCNTDR